MPRTISRFLPLLLFVAACSPAGESASVPQLTLVEELRIGGAEEGPASFTTIAGLGFDAEGRIWVLDRQTQELRVFGRNGEFVRNIGQRGSGPGEFQEING